MLFRLGVFVHDADFFGRLAQLSRARPYKAEVVGSTLQRPLHTAFGG